MGAPAPYKYRMVKTAAYWKEGKPAVAASKKGSRYYPAEDVKTKLANHHNTRKQTKLRGSITPGTVVIPGRSLQGKACCFPQAARLWSHARHWPIQGQWCATPSCAPVVRHCDPDQGRRVQRSLTP